MRKTLKFLWLLRTSFERAFKVAEKIDEVEKLGAVTEECERLDIIEGINPWEQICIEACVWLIEKGASAEGEDDYTSTNF